MRYLLNTVYFLALLLFSSCIKELELEYNAYDDPDVQIIMITDIEVTPQGSHNNLRVNFSVRTDLLTPGQNAKISKYRIYENGNLVVNIANKNQRYFIRNDRLRGTTLNWEIVPVIGDVEGFRSKVYVYVV